MSDLVWHYTTGQKFELIAECGLLMPTEVGIAKNEKPVLWFSKNQSWEPTANKMRRSPDGKLIFLDQLGTAEHGGGLVRFGIKKNSVHHWHALIKAACIPETTVRSLEAAGIKQGAKPSDWCGTLKPVNVDECSAIEVLNQDGKWERVAEHENPPKKGDQSHEA
jgi:hypothetical protein